MTIIHWTVGAVAHDAFNLGYGIWNSVSVAALLGGRLEYTVPLSHLEYTVNADRLEFTVPLGDGFTANEP